MKYWVFQTNQVTGPFDPDDLSQVPGYSAETLVCPEGRKGTNMGDWQRAGMVPELSLSLLKASRLAATVAAGPSSRGYASLPPEPTLKDLAALGSLQEKVGLLEGTVGGLQEALRRKETEILSLHRELDSKEAKAQELAGKMTAMEGKLGAVAALSEGLDKASAAEKELQATAQRQRTTIDELTTQLEALKERLAGMETLKGQVEELRNRPVAPPPAPFEAAPAPAPSPFGAPAGRAFTPPAASFSPPPIEPPAAAPPPEAAPPTPALEAPPLDLPPKVSAEATLPPTPALEAPQAAPPPSVFMGTEPSAPPESPGFLDPTASAPAPSPAPAEGGLGMPAAGGAVREEAAAPEGDLAAKPRAGKGKLLFVVLGLAVLAAAGIALQLGIIPMGAKPPVAEPPPETPAAVEPPPPPPVDPVEEQKAAAIDLVKGWRPGAGDKSLSELLEAGGGPVGGALSPWMSEKLPDGSFQVNFYAAAGPGKPARIFEFEARLHEKKVLPRNPAAKDLFGAKAPPSRKGGKAKRAPKPAVEAASEAGLVEDLLGAEETPASQPPSEAAPEPKAKAKAGRKAPRAGETGESLDELLDGGQPAPKKPKAKREATLDELLLPGFAKGGGLQEPQAQPSRQPAPRAKAPKKTSGGGKAADAELLDDLLK